MSEAMSYILGVDFGSTTFTAKIYNQDADLITATSVKVPYLHPVPGAVEIDPEALWDLFVDVVKATLTKSDISASEIKAFGICCQRGTIMLWDKDTGKPCCNLISWQDTRCIGILSTMNNSWMLKTMNIVGTILYTFLRQKRFLVMKVLKFQYSQALVKLVWLFKNNPELKQAALNETVLFGTLESWIIWKLTKGMLHFTDYSCASGTGMWDPYICEWSLIMPYMFDCPREIFPPFSDTSGHICDVHEDIFGASFPLTAVVADTQAGAFAQLCFEAGDVSCTLGTGCFFSVNTGSYAHTSISGIYPQVGWKIGEELTYLCEGHIAGIATSLEWAHLIGLFDDVSETAEIARSVEDSAGVCFIPGFLGLTAPYADPHACAGMIGIHRNTTKAHLVCAILEGIAFRFYEMYNVVVDETHVPFHPVVKVCGGVTKNDFLMKLISSLTGCTIVRSLEHDMSLLGSVFLAGLGAGIWKNKDEIRTLRNATDSFYPDQTIKDKHISMYKNWKEAAKRCLHWYKE